MIVMMIVIIIIVMIVAIVMIIECTSLLYDQKQPKHKQGKAYKTTNKNVKDSMAKDATVSQTKRALIISHNTQKT